MARWFLLVVVLLPLAAPLTQPARAALTTPDPAVQILEQGPSPARSYAAQSVPLTALFDPAGRVLMAHGIDLRDVDWSKMKPGGNGNGEAVKAETNGDDEGGDDEDGEGDDEGKDEEEEGEGGWNRTWDAPKMG